MTSLTAGRRAAAPSSAAGGATTDHRPGPSLLVIAAAQLVLVLDDSLVRTDLDEAVAAGRRLPPDPPDPGEARGAADP